MNLKQYFDLKLIHQSEMARRIGISPNYMFKIKNFASCPSLDIMQRIVEITEGRCTIEDLTPPKKPTKRCGHCGQVLPKKMQVKNEI
jgi:hypothetical protein